MTSTSGVQIIDDDDEFDWEAAVQAIDAACENTKNPNLNLNSVNKPSTSRQSTLDKFIGSRVPKPQDENIQIGRDSNPDPAMDQEGDSCLKIDHEAAKTWIYPVNVPLRDYQFAITKTSLFSNTLVTLPTGLGKTLIAAVVMYNYFRWFPEGKIVFTAPSKPLVMQQIEACHNIVGIPQEWTIDLTGETSPIKRVSFWEAKRVFFATPQVLEKDIESGKCLVERIVCLVIDEAHRATGNYSYCVAVRKLMDRNVQLRILALSATPGSKQLAIQQIIDNLQISTLEYRNERDHDVLPYVHDKKIELVKVAMGQDADDIESLLSEVIRPYASKLCAFELLPKRDFQTLSPYDLLNSRAKFRQAPPGNLHQTKYGEIEGDFGLLLTLIHIRKFLTGYGVRPAFEMLEENRSSLNRLSKNEAFQKLKILMKHSLSRGVTTPKLSKMLEVLIDHFKTNDPLNSRVIIFSNYRGIVRDIMNALADIGHIIKATEFIGQSSGKTSKGQSQKIQQAVLKKFRDGGYNVIVATSIGEEGLDIMEVDLVICYDANVSPLRMIQRMGRTGRNHEGRVVVLACEGTELKAYLQKQGSCKTLDKHMRNGGRTSFNFHSSPRMIPHIYKPEVQYVELSIKQFVPRDKKVLDDLTIQPPIFEAKLNDAETDLLRKYFQPTENLWGPSLIAFPHFQAFPSRVHNVMHSFRSGMLIDTMQYLQGLSYIRDNKACFDEAVAVSDLSASCEIGEHRDRRMNELQTLYKSGNVNSQREVSDSHVPSLSPTKREEKHCFTNFLADNPSTHSYLFGSDFVSVDALGRVLLSVPLLPLKDACSKCTSASSGGLQSCFKQDACGVKEDSVVEYEIETKQVNYFGATQTVFKGNKMVHAEFSDSDSDSDSDSRQERSLNVDDKVSETPICSKKFSNGKTSEAVHVEKKTAYESGNCVGDVELSPRLTNLLKSGVVPESPTDNSGTQECKRKCEFLDDDLDSPSKGQTKVILNSSVRVKLDKVIDDSNASEVLPSSINIEVPSFAINGNNVSAINSAAFPVVEDVGTPPENPLASSCSEDWHFTSGDNSESVSKARKYKRLRKYGDLQTKHPLEKNESRIDKAELGRSSACTNRKHIRGEKKMTEDVRVFIEEQAEVSGELPLSEDDDDEPDNNSYDDSFIDDRINLTAGSTPTEDRNRDMMAIYRRSLLSQSPIVRLPIPLMDNTPDSSVSRDQITYSISSERIKHSPRTPQTGLESECTGWNSEVSRLNPERNPDSVLCNSGTRREDENNIESRKRKIDSYQVGPLPVQNLEHEFLCQSEPHVKHLPQPEWINRNNPTTVEFEDDEFYEGIDLDAVEEEAKRYLECKSQMSVQNQILNPEPAQNLGEPTFDLGI